MPPLLGVVMTFSAKNNKKTLYSIGCLCYNKYNYDKYEIKKDVIFDEK